MIDFAHLFQVVSGTVLRGTFNIPNKKIIQVLLTYIHSLPKKS